jgi:hypothetical protein
MTYVRDKADAFIRPYKFPSPSRLTTLDNADVEALIHQVIEDCARIADERCHAKVCHQDTGYRIRALATPPPPRPEGPTCASCAGKGRVWTGIGPLGCPACHGSGNAHPPQPEKG